MTWAHWVLILVPLLWVGFVVWIARGGFDADEYCECRNCADGIGRLEVWLEQPVREACELTDDEQARFDEITRGARR